MNSLIHGLQASLWYSDGRFNQHWILCITPKSIFLKPICVINSQKSDLFLSNKSFPFVGDSPIITYFASLPIYGMDTPACLYRSHRLQFSILFNNTAPYHNIFFYVFLFYLCLFYNIFLFRFCLIYNILLYILCIEIHTHLLMPFFYQSNQILFTFYIYYIAS